MGLGFRQSEEAFVKQPFILNVLGGKDFKFNQSGAHENPLAFFQLFRSILNVYNML